MPNHAVRRRALVTGASSGIGRACAEALAARGMDLVIAARRHDRLEAAAADLRTRHGVDVLVQACDLSDPAAASRLVAAIHDRGLHVDVLVNNAGYGVAGTFERAPWETHRAFLQVMVTAPCELSYLVLPGMIERRWGRILNIASLAARLPAPAGHTLYAASKAFLIPFSEALHAEHAQHGVHTTALCPGFTYTEFHDVLGTRDQVRHMPSWLWMDAATVAAQGIDAVMAGRPVLISGRVNRTTAWLARVLPQRLVRHVVRRQGRHFRKT